MKMKYFLAVWSLVFFWACESIAATLIESQIADGSRHKIWLAGGIVRVDVSSEPSYLLADTVAGKMYSINPGTREIFDLGNLAGGRIDAKPSKKVDVKFEEKGEGPQIAGYKTTHFLFSVNGRKCGDEYLSKQAMEDIASFEMLKKMNEMTSSGFEGVPEGMIDPCDLGQMELDEYYGRFGFPLRIVNNEGVAEVEVIRIASDQKPPSPGFEIPEDFTSVQMDQVLQEEMQQDEAPAVPPAGMISPDVNSEDLQRMIQEMMQQQRR